MMIGEKQLNYLKGGYSGFADLAYDEKAIYFAWHNNFKQIKSLAGCRGFMMESAFGSLNGYGYGVGGWEPEEGCVNFEKMELIVAAQKGLLPDKIETIIDFLNLLEDKLGFSHTVVYRASNINKNDAFLFDGDKKWMNSPFAISFYMFCIRTVAIHGHVIGNSLEKTMEAFYKKSVDVVKTAYDDYNDDYNDYSNEEYFKTYHVGVDDYYCFAKSYSFIKKLIKYGYAPFFYEECIDNFPNIVSGIHDYGMLHVASKMKLGCGSMLPEAKKAIMYSHRFKSDREVTNWIKENAKPKAIIVAQKKKAAMKKRLPAAIEVKSKKPANKKTAKV